MLRFGARIVFRKCAGEITGSSPVALTLFSNTKRKHAECIV